MTSFAHRTLTEIAVARADCRQLILDEMSRAGTLAFDRERLAMIERIQDALCCAHVVADTEAHRRDLAERAWAARLAPDALRDAAAAAVYDDAARADAAEAADHE